MLLVVDESTETGQRALFIFRLVACLGTFDQDFFGNTGIRVLPDIAQTHSGFYLINILSTRAATSESIPFDLSFVDDHIELFRFRKYGYRSCRSMYTSLSLCGGNTLYAVYTRFILQCAVNIVSRDATNYFLVSAGSSFIGVGDFQFPSFYFAVFGIHAEKVTGKDCRFIASCSTTNFKNGILAVLRVGRNKH